MLLLYNKRREYKVDGHPELVSGSVRGEGQEKARGEILKQVQHDATQKKRLTRREAEGE